MGRSFQPGGPAGMSQAVNGFVRGLGSGTWNTPDSVAVSIVGDIDLDAKIKPPNWTAGTIGLIQKDDAATQRSYGLQLNAGLIRFFYTNDGVTPRTADSTAALSTVFTTGATGWVRATYVAATGVVTFYTSFDGVTWTALGTTVSLTIGAIFDSTSLLYILGNASIGYTADVYRARIYTGLRQSAGVLAADFDPRRYSSGTTFTAVTGEVWTTTGPLPRYT